jgi:1-acyl-sn-glycerol-3-phosphate acyltransferase
MLADLLDPNLDSSDPGSRDPDFIRRFAFPALDAIRAHYFRGEAHGTEHLPLDRPFIAVANHNGGPILADTWTMLAIWWSVYGIERPSYAMIHDLPLRIPVLRNVLLKIGALRASTENARTVLGMGMPLLVYPGGELDCLKSFWKRNRIDFHGRTGFIKLALEHGVPIVPVVNAGGHEVYFTLFSSPRLAEWTGLSRLTRVKTLPLNVGLPWGVWLTGFVPFVPLPAKLTYKVGEPIWLGHDPDAAKNPSVVRRAYARVTDTMQTLLDDLAARRRFPVFG